MKRLLRPLFVAVFFVAAHFSRAAIPPAENLLPSDTLLVVTIPDCAAFRSNLHQSPHWLLWNDPAMKAFHDKFISNYREQFAAPLERDLGVKLSDFADFPQGQFTFAVTANGWSGNDDNSSPGIVLLLDAKDKSSLLKTNITALQKKWRDDGKTIRTEKIGAIPFSIVTLASNDIPSTLQNMFPSRPPVQELGRETKPSRPDELVVGQFESLLIVGNSLKAVEPVVQHLTGGSRPALKDNPVFAADKLSQFRNQPLYFGWFNAKTYFQILSQIPEPEPNPEAPSPLPQMPWQTILNASGLTGMKSASFAYLESHDGARLNLFISVPESSRAGIFKIFSLEPKEANPPSFVPADVVKFSRTRLDGKKAWNEFENALKQVSPVVGTYLDSAINIANATAQAKDPSFDLRKNLIGNLGDDFISYEKAPAASNPSRSLFLFSAQNPEQAVIALNTLATLVYRKAVPEPRDFMGRKIYTIPLPVNPNGISAGPARSLYVSSGNGYVAVSSDSAMMEEFLRQGQSGGKSLRETAGFAIARQQVGGAGNGMFGYANQRETWRAIFKAKKDSPVLTPMSNVENNIPFLNLQNGIRGWMDFSLLPDFDKVSKYFYISVSSGSMNNEGYTFKIFAPRPPGLN
ncbi:MAG TPA: hypothetical protein VFV23_08010 [Verrucomicrobiae bacterium]|nr:hypothetical protein [Verrucomicrobiae bacterium]